MNLNTSQVSMDDYEDIIQLCFDAGVAIGVESGPGVGKTKGIEAYARRRNAELADEGGYGLFELNLANANVADIQGYNMPEKAEDTDWEGKPVSMQVSRMTYAFFLYDKFTGKPAYKFKYGCIVVEEYGQGGGDEKKAIQQLVEEHRICGRYYPDFDVALLMNRMKDRSGVTKDFDHALNRRAQFELVPTLKSLLVYAQKAGWSTMTMAYAARNEADVFAGKVPDVQGPYLTPRSLEKMDSLVRAAEAQGRDLKDPVLMAACAAVVGLGAAGKYTAFVDARSRIPTVSAIVKDPEGTKVPGLDEMDVAMFLVFDLASKTTRENLKPICDYVRRLPSDMALTYWHALTNRDKSFVMTREFTDFSVDNLSLLTLVAAKRGGK